MDTSYKPDLTELLQSLDQPHVIIREPSSVSNKLQKLIQDGADQLHVIADYDMTLTKYLVNGRPNVISHAALSLTDRVSASFKERVAALHLEYLPYQTSTSMEYVLKYQKMDECWNRYNEVYIDEKLSRHKLGEALRTLNIEFRVGIKPFIHHLNKKAVPMTVLSAGITDVIEELLEQHNLMTEHIHVLSNEMIYQTEPPHYCIDFTSPPIHILNKDKVTITKPEYAAKLSNRANILLLGDSLGDLKMSHSFQHQQVLSIGFLNNDWEDKLDSYCQAYDIVITHDGDFSLINDIVQQI